MTYRFDVEHRSDGSARITCGSYEAPDSNALARRMVNAGEPDGAISGGRPGRDDWRVRSLHAHAAVSVVEGDAGLGVVPYKPYPGTEVAPALQNAISARAVAIRNRREGVGR